MFSLWYATVVEHVQNMLRFDNYYDSSVFATIRYVGDVVCFFEIRNGSFSEKRPFVFSAQRRHAHTLYSITPLEHIYVDVHNPIYHQTAALAAAASRTTTSNPTWASPDRQRARGGAAGAGRPYMSRAERAAEESKEIAKLRCDIQFFLW